LKAGYDSRPLNTGDADTGVSVSNKRSVFFQQLAFNAEAVSDSWNVNAYALVPVGDTGQQLNSAYQGGSLNIIGLDVGYFITPVVNASVDYYYQDGDLGTADGSDVLGRLAYEISNGLTAGMNISYDEAFDTRVSAYVKVNFDGPSTTSQRKAVQQLTVINALTSTPSNRDIRIHDPADSPRQEIQDNREDRKRSEARTSARSQPPTAAATTRPIKPPKESARIREKIEAASR